MGPVEGLGGGGAGGGAAGGGWGARGPERLVAVGPEGLVAVGLVETLLLVSMRGWR